VHPRQNEGRECGLRSVALPAEGGTPAWRFRASESRRPPMDRNGIEESLRRLREQPPLLYDPRTLEPLDQEGLREVQAHIAGLIEEGLLEAAGERDGRVVWRLTDFGKAQARLGGRELPLQ